ncbi:translation initiation factor IF-3 [Bacteriovorax stolpii]|uniref:Translation initiation factor IF-3 n=1 Tax=Bacteriovorax stolpii TaxID=960 RepID=A0A2K9NT03_BACTC|nr:translation initiation factor IF-3 [Bacteriovorax stolpii]AUN98651.1 translation initiation factor IF-3 [Bacteriovorax stolpii]QDK41369.1 translation initiation factor IF-3 [Bacteriovorax stolpii]
MKDNQSPGSFQRPSFDRDRQSNKNQGPRVNEQIRIPECRLLGDDGHQYGVVSMAEARRISDEAGLDLVEVSPTAQPPVVKLIDFGKYKYELQKKAQEAKKKQIVIQLKEVQLRPNIEQGDLDTKLNHCRKFLDQGDKIKISMQFRGREMSYRDAGMEKFKAIIGQIVEMGAVIESEPKMMGNRIIAILASTKKPPVKKAEDKPAASEQKAKKD